MHIRRLALTNFRNYHGLDLEFSPGRLLFLGDNAQGKSNLLEAAHMLASGRSRRAGQDSEVIGWETAGEGQPFARLQGGAQRAEGQLQLELLIAGPPQAPAMGRGGKRFRVNGIARRSVDFTGQLRAVLFTADDLDVVSGPPANRRGFLDAMLSQTDRGYHAALQRYTRLMQQRNATLRRIKEGIAQADELSLWDDGFSREAATIIALRQSSLTGLAARAGEAHATLSGTNELLELGYEPELGSEWQSLLPAEAMPKDVQPLFATALAAQRRRETAAGISLVGPHRDDISIRLNGVAAASFGSRAQIRTAALALRLAEAELLRGQSNDAPVILLDDILSEMDERRRDAVLGALDGFEQVWVTATKGSPLPPDFVSQSMVYEVEGGQVRPGG